MDKSRQNLPKDRAPRSQAVIQAIGEHVLKDAKKGHVDGHKPDFMPSAPGREAAEQKLSPLGKRFFGLIEFDDDEEMICEIRKHPIGLLSIYFTGLVVLIVVLVVSVFLSNWLGSGDVAGVDFDPNLMKTLMVVVAFILVVLVVAFTAISAILYRSNVIFVTNEKLAQVLYKNIFDRKISQLGLGDIQDVTTNQTGILPRVFNYGTLVIETAGEQNNYIFTYTPYPYECTRAIIGAHERDKTRFGN